MKLISEIINELVDSEKSITSPLLKTKVLASRLKSSELLTWTNNELGGYENEEPTPDYRKFACNITGTYLNGYNQFNDQPLPTHGLPKKIEESMQSLKITQSAATLESLSNEKKTGQLESEFSAETIALLQNNIRNMGNPYLQILKARKSISISAVTEITASIRSKLLDFMLKIEEEFGSVTEIEELKKSNERITTIMNQTIITNTGDGNVLNTGSNSKIDANITINKGDKEALSNTLKENGLTVDDVAELVTVIDEEQPSENGAFGTKVNTWVQKMLGKALDGSWQVGIGAAGSLLADALQAYYGK